MSEYYKQHAAALLISVVKFALELIVGVQQDAVAVHSSRLSLGLLSC